MNLIMSWVDRSDEGMADLIAKDQAYHKVASVPHSRMDVVLRQKARFNAIIGQHRAGDGTIDWASVSVAFQAHLDRLLSE
jgi:hypothetical protein